MPKKKATPRRKRPKPKPGDTIYYGGMVFKVGPRGGHIPQPQIGPPKKR